ncbi:LacI family transcriptional regulator [Clostridia bacterium]|nr:LacI family transcriptional regulator [Clostridia bacterium]
MHVTIKDIAVKSGVSMATVSRVINKAPHVSQKAEQKVLKAIDELNYIPSAYARGLSRHESDIIGIVIPEITNPFFGEIITGVTQIADEKGLNILIFNTDEDAAKEARVFQILQEYRVRGIIVTPVTGINTFDKDYVRLFEKLNIPIVLMDRRIKNGRFDGVFFDDRAALYQATSLLLENEHRNITILTGNPKHVITQGRVQGYRDAFEAYNVPVSEKNLIQGKFTIESAYEITKDLITDKKLPTAFVGISNMLSMGCLKALYEYHISIPEDISFVGYDKLEFFDLLNINLTLVEKDAVEMGRRAAMLMIDKLSGKNTQNRVVLMPEMVIRGSEQFPARNQV